MNAKEQGLPELPQNVTEDQRRAIQSFVHSAIVPLIEDVIVKKLGQAAIVLRDELSGAAHPPALARVAVTEAMVEAACAKFWQHWGNIPDKEFQRMVMRDVLTAALAATHPTQEADNG